MNFYLKEIDLDYPRPQLRRRDWLCLDGTWQVMLDDEGRHALPSAVAYEREIKVPYAPETKASGVHETGFHRRVWYRREVQLGAAQQCGPGERLLLHFGAVNYRARIWIDGKYAAEHSGGHSPFSIDITDFTERSDTLAIVVQADDDPLDMHKVRGKQDWQLDPHSIWYPRSSGIWRTVWLEKVAASHLKQLRWSSDVAFWQIRLDAEVSQFEPGSSLQVNLRLNGKLLVADRCMLTGTALGRNFQLPDPGIDDARADWMWSPENPQLIDAELILMDPDGNAIDTVASYTALRTAAVEGDRFILNSRPYYLRMVLDQGYWPESLMMATSDQLRDDVMLIKRLGFNGARKHQKSEDPRWLYWCDVLGLCVWGEMPSAYGFSNRTVHGVLDEWKALLERDYSHPCIVAWVPTNESWGVPELTHDQRQVDFVKAMYHVTRSLDATRPVVGNDGWEIPCGDFVNIHDYHEDPEVLFERYGDHTRVAHTLAHVRPQRRRLLIDGFDARDKPVMLSEFGGIACIDETKEAGWGYSVASDGEQLLQRYKALMASIHRCKGLVGFCYTQLTDTFLEKNGLLTEDRVPKAPIEELAKATRGPRAELQDWYSDPLGHSELWRKKTASHQLQNSTGDEATDWRTSGKFITLPR